MNCASTSAAFGIERQARKEIARTQADAVAEEQHADAGHARFDTAGDHVHVGAGALHEVLRLQLAQRRHLIAQVPRARIQRLLACSIASASSSITALLRPSRNISRDARRAVILHVDQLHARRGAATDLVLQARARAIAEIAVLALTHLEQLLHQAEAFAHGEGARIRPEIAPRLIARRDGRPAADNLRRRQINIRDSFCRRAAGCCSAA
jgi:hypothetical protein